MLVGIIGSASGVIHFQRTQIAIQVAEGISIIAAVVHPPVIGKISLFHADAAAVDADGIMGSVKGDAVLIWMHMPAAVSVRDIAEGSATISRKRNVYTGKVDDVRISGIDAS